MKPNDHRLDPARQTCIGCGLQASEIKERGSKECEGFYAEIVLDPTDEKARPMIMVISTDEELALLRPDGSSFRLPQRAMFELRDQIELGVDELRAGRRSRRG
jgi:hypothetical protein